MISNSLVGKNKSFKKIIIHKSLRFNFKKKIIYLLAID